MTMAIAGAGVGTTTGAAGMVRAGWLAAIDALGLGRATDTAATLVIDLDRRTYVAMPRPGLREMRLVISGELDLASAPPLLDALASALHHRPAVVALDLRRLEFIDARGAGVLAMTALQTREWGGALTLREPQAPVWRVLCLRGLGHLVHVGG